MTVFSLVGDACCPGAPTRTGLAFLHGRVKPMKGGLHCH